MRNIFLFIQRFFNLLLFLALEGLAIYTLSKYNKTHEAFFASISNEVTGTISEKYNRIEYYFRLKKTNEQLASENANLRRMLRSSFEAPDTAKTTIIDSLANDTLGVRKFNFLVAKVVNNSVSQENNYLTLHRGAKQGVKVDMGVIGPDGIVGKVILVSENYSRVMSLLNRKSRVSAMLQKGFYTGDLEWDGKDPNYLTLNKIPKSAKVQKGDTVLTSNISERLSFPPGIMIGRVVGISTDPSSNFFTLKINSATNFYTLQYVYLTDNLLGEEQKALEAKTPKD
jgi:rod shape-determining protein MreC